MPDRRPTLVEEVFVVAQGSLQQRRPDRLQAGGIERVPFDDARGEAIDRRQGRPESDLGPVSLAHGPGQAESRADESEREHDQSEEPDQRPPPDAGR